MRSIPRLSTFFIAAGLILLVGQSPAQACHGWFCHRCAARAPYRASAGAAYGSPMTGGYGANYGSPPAYGYPMTGGYGLNYNYPNPYDYRPRYRNEDERGKTDDGGDGGSSDSASTTRLTIAIQDYDRRVRVEMENKLRELDTKLEGRLDKLVTSINEIKTSLAGAPPANPVRPNPPASPAPTALATPLESRVTAMDGKLEELQRTLGENKIKTDGLETSLKRIEVALGKLTASTITPPTTRTPPATASGELQPPR